MNELQYEWAELRWLRIGPVAGCCEHCDGFSISKKVGDYIHHLSRRQLLKKDSAPGRHFHFILLYWTSRAKQPVSTVLCGCQLCSGSRCSLFDLALRECRTPEFTMLRRVGNTLKSQRCLIGYDVRYNFLFIPLPYSHFFFLRTIHFSKCFSFGV